MKKILIAAAAIGISAMLTAGTADASARTHTAVKDDTFWKLSLQYKVALNELIQANSHINPLNIQIGSKLHIPGNNVEASGQLSAASAPASAPQLLTAKSEEAQPSVTVNGQSYAYTSTLDVKATAYTAAAAENGKWGAVDYFGNPLKVGTVAVDPKMIPLGTKLYVTGYSYDGLPTGGMLATATDMGGSIKGNRIDLFVPGTTKQALKFGIQDVKVYVLNP